MTAGSSLASIPRTAAAVREVLAEHDVQLHDRFVTEFHIALAETDEDFDTSRIDRLLGRWWAQACALLNPDPEVDAAQRRLQAGDTSDLVEAWQPQTDGSQAVYYRTTDDEWVFARVIPAEDV